MAPESEAHRGPGTPVVCFSHLAFEPTLFQRPQHIMVRLAGLGHPVLFAAGVGFEGRRRLAAAGQPMAGDIEFGAGHLHYVNHYHSPFSRMAAVTVGAFARVVRQWSRREAGRPVVWLYHPGFLPQALGLNPVRVVYDVMDRFGAFEKRSPASARMERNLLERADTVFTGGRSLHEAVLEDCKQLAQGDSGKVVCIPSGVDSAHFARALSPDAVQRADLPGLRRPVYGYVGAVDERLDFDLLVELALAEPAATVLLIGPVLSRPDRLPPNIVLAGPRPYADLPSVLRAVDVALIPFRQDGVAAFTSPTKTPEYLAAGKPVVSTPVPDVVADYGDLVGIARTPAQFVEQCRAAVQMLDTGAALSAEASRRAASWDAIAERMKALAIP